MEQYIKKSALVAEIKERIKTYNKGYANGDDRRADALEVLLHDIDTIEVKEVDLNEEIEKCLKKHNMLAVGKKDFTDIAKHFFSLGIAVSNKAQKGE